jgi:hypothetical protein
MRAQPALASTATDAQLMQGGQQVCITMDQPGATRYAIIEILVQKGEPAALASARVSAAQQYLCPDKQFATSRAAAIPTASPAPIAVTPAAPIAVAPAAPINARDWLLVAKDPAGHAGQRIIVYGNVTQFDAGTGTSTFRANIDGVAHRVKYGYIDYPTNTMLTGDLAVLANVVQGDLFTAEVTVTGPYIYQNTMGGQMSVPLLNVTKLTVTGHIAH